jgi:hypothetical protein
MTQTTALAYRDLALAIASAVEAGAPENERIDWSRMVASGPAEPVGAWQLDESGKWVEVRTGYRHSKSDETLPQSKDKS